MAMRFAVLLPCFSLLPSPPPLLVSASLSQSVICFASEAHAFPSPPLLLVCAGRAWCPMASSGSGLGTPPRTEGMACGIRVTLPLAHGV
eukprot:863882-Pyramimonas_sp.AAC.1